MKSIKYIIAIILALPILWVAGLAFLPYKVSIYLTEFDAKKRQAFIQDMNNIDKCWTITNGEKKSYDQCLVNHGLGYLAKYDRLYVGQ